MENINKNVEDNRKNIDKNKRGIEKITGLNYPIISGAVVAFDLGKGCPEGWSRYEQAESRVIIGATHRDHFSDRSELTQYKYDDKGGKEEFIITYNELPSHEHEFKDMYYVEDPRWFEGISNEIETRAVPGAIGSKGTDYDNKAWLFQNVTSPTGNLEDIKIKHVSPYIALYYCKRD